MSTHRVFAAVLLGLLLADCAPVQVGPFVPHDAPFCGSDLDCHDDQVCKFPGVDTRAVCMPGDNAYPNLARP